MNTNCLEGMMCPNCGYYKEFHIAIRTMARVTDEGSEVTGDHEWDDDSFCLCPKCGESGPVGAFYVGETCGADC
jgi:hypothetical protein